jgi:membrane protein DedA with SNARE-associated domain
VFTETGLVVMPFLPGDSLLFVVGALCGAGLMNLPLAMGVLLAAAILGDQVNYTIGRFFGPKVFQWEDSRFFNKRAFDAGARLLREARRHHHHPGALHALHPHLCALRGRCGRDDRAKFTPTT